MKFDFDNQVIIVTGGTRGIGRKISEDLILLNAYVIATGTNKDEINYLNKLNKYDNLIFRHLDFLDKYSLESFIDDIEKRTKIDVLINNAGINRLNEIQNYQDNDLDDMFKVNLAGPFSLTRTVSKKMIINNYGKILNIGSIFGTISKPKRSIYTSTKSGIHGLTIGSSNDLSKYNILCNTLSPGFVLTDLTKKNLSKSELKKLEKQIPLGRLASVNDISSTAIYLTSNLNYYLTGQNIIVDGGFSNI